MTKKFPQKLLSVSKVTPRVTKWLKSYWKCCFMTKRLLKKVTGIVTSRLKGQNKVIEWLKSYQKVSYSDLIANQKLQWLKSEQKSYHVDVKFPKITSKSE